MNLSEQEIEAMLRHAPRPRPPAFLKEQLEKQVAPPTTRPDDAGVISSQRGGWLRRWWPVLLPGTVSLACAAIVVVQHQEIRKLRGTVEVLTKQATSAHIDTNRAPATVTQPDRSSDEGYQEETERLKSEASQLKATLDQAQQLQAENQELEAKIAANAGMASSDLAALKQANEHALRLKCVNNLKQFGLAARVFASDNNDIYPPDVVSMSNELASTQILICPSDTNRPAARDWTSFSKANCSYEYLAPSGTDLEPERVLARCRIHNNVCLCDGSVQQLGPNRTLVKRDGKYYLKN